MASESETAVAGDAALARRIERAIATLGQSLDELRRVGTRDSPTIPAIGETTSAGHTGSSGPGRRKRRFRPWDYGAFVERERTFGPFLWFGKLEAADSASCASHGWECFSRNALRCVGCEAELRFELPESEGASEAEYTSDFAGRLRSEHRKYCPWSSGLTMDDTAADLVARRRDEVGAESASPTPGAGAGAAESGEESGLSAERVRQRIKRELESLDNLVGA